MEKNKVSIVLPVYNIVRWLDACMESLVSQQYTNIEILLGDDGSTDGSAELCDKWAQKDERVRVIHKKNGGAASARNACLDQATGEYICFVDSDDTVDKAYVAHLVETVEKHDADIAVCGFAYLKTTGCETVSCTTAPGVYNKTEYLHRFLEDWSCSLLWNKIYRRDIVGEIRMDEGHRIDDEYFTYQVCLNARTVVVTAPCLYYYRMRKSSVMNVSEVAGENTMMDRIGYVSRRYAHIAQELPDAEQAYFQDALDTLARYYVHSLKMPRAQKAIREWAKAHCKRWWKLPISLKQKIAYQVLFFLSKPKYCGESSPVPSDAQEYFD